MTVFYCYQNLFLSDEDAPMPWVGVYAAAASLACFIALATDAFTAFRRRKLWFQCNFFTINAFSLTLLGVAMKMPLDLKTPMYGPSDQLAKLSSTAMMSIVIGNFLPSLGPMDDKDIFMNIAALGILVITVVINVCIQLNTGAIPRLVMPNHVVVVCFMLLSFIMLTASAFTVASTKKQLELKYNKIRKLPSSDGSEEAGRSTIEKLKVYVKKYWMIAETGNPQFVMGRSVTCCASGLISCLTALVLVEAEFRLPRDYFLSQQAHNFTESIDYFFAQPQYCLCNSAYKWSTLFIVIIQTACVGVGILGPAFRWFISIKFKCSKGTSKIYQTNLKPESYWIERLEEWKESYLLLQIRGPKCRKLAQGTKDLILNFCIRVQIVIVVASKLIMLTSTFIIGPMLWAGRYCNEWWRKQHGRESGASSNKTVSETTSHMEQLDPGLYVLRLEGEDELPERILRNIGKAADKWILKNKKHKPKNLLELLQKAEGFKGVAEFDSDQVVPLDSQKLSNCWALPVVTLASMAIAIAKTEKDKVDWLVRSVSEGLFYVSVVEKSMDDRGNLTNIRNATDKVWSGVEVYSKWLDENLKGFGTSARETLEKLAEIAENIVMEFHKNKKDDHPSQWPVKVIAANSMYRISKTVLLDYCEDTEDQIDEKTLFEKLSCMIGGILCACLTNLPVVITKQCFSSAFEKREKSVRLAAQILGETEEILKLLEQHEVLPFVAAADQFSSVEEWRAKFKQEKPMACQSSSNNIAADSSLGELSVHDADLES